jgi:tRNA A37 threonylcarbamoyladenosine dehydratase
LWIRASPASTGSTAPARSGVGKITLIDADDVCVSNTNRQSHAMEGAYGRMKVEAVAERLRAINPHIRSMPSSMRAMRCA